ncbi:MAG: hypothetical protein AABZ61_03295 [Bacteroidota bacterium]|jgi:hypothetical protein
MIKLKPLSKEGIAAALEKAERYRLLNEPSEAESICLDVLEIEPDNQKALVTLLLSFTDQFDGAISVQLRQARGLLSRLADHYKRAYYAGIISERQAKAILKQRAPGCEAHAYEWLHEAMEHFEEAESICAPGNDEAILRWNSCVRMIMKHNLAPRQEQYFEPPLE